MMYRLFGKRVLDVLLSSILILLLVPIFGIIIVLNYLFEGRPIFFRQLRSGYNGQTFEIIKFRTMIIGSSKDNSLRSDTKMITPFGNFLRKTSLDEITELVNVFLGHMSLVGPRPLPVTYEKYFTPTQALRLRCKPGITGLAQVNGRNSISWEEKFDFDIRYYQDFSFVLDTKILFRTFFIVFSRRGISYSDNETMPPFHEK